MALGATAATERVFEAFLSEDRRRTLFHGHSFTANPLACAAALASLDLLQEAACAERIRRIGTQHAAFAKKIKAYDIVRDVRILGTVIAFGISQGEDGYINPAGLDLTQKAMEEGIYLRPLGNTVYILPPYCITEEELEKIYDFLEGYIKKARS